MQSYASVCLLPFNSPLCSLIPSKAFITWRNATTQEAFQMHCFCSLCDFFLPTSCNHF
jgi:hypothetical protein